MFTNNLYCSDIVRIVKNKNRFYTETSKNVKHIYRKPNVWLIHPHKYWTCIQGIEYF